MKEEIQADENQDSFRDMRNRLIKLYGLDEFIKMYNEAHHKSLEEQKRLKITKE